MSDTATAPKAKRQWSERDRALLEKALKAAIRDILKHGLAEPTPPPLPKDVVPPGTVLALPASLTAPILPVEAPERFIAPVETAYLLNPQGEVLAAGRGDDKNTALPMLEANCIITHNHPGGEDGGGPFSPQDLVSMIAMNAQECRVVYRNYQGDNVLARFFRAPAATWPSIEDFRREGQRITGEVYDDFTRLVAPKTLPEVYTEGQFTELCACELWRRVSDFFALHFEHHLVNGKEHANGAS